MMPAAKHFDPVLGIDIHIVAPMGPMPHPFIGFLFDPFDYLPWIGATVFINGLPRATAGSLGRTLPFHFPIGGTFVLPPGNEGEMFMGSSTASFDGEAASYGLLPVLTCQSIGFPAPPRLFGKKPRKGKTRSLLLPTSIVLPIPLGKPALVGGSPTISLTSLLIGAGSMMALRGLGKGLKRLKNSKVVQKAAKATSNAMHSAADGLMTRIGVSAASKGRNRVHRSICTLTGHPVDVATGKVLTDAVDFALPGPLPLSWERVWYSTSTYAGPLGHGWHHALDLALWAEDDAVVVRLADGRHAAFAPPAEDTPSWNAQERMTLHRTRQGYRLVEDASGVSYHFLTGPFRLRLRRVEERDEATGETSFRLVPVDGPVEVPLARMEDRNGNKIELHRDAVGRLAGITDSAGRRLEVESDANGRIVRITAPHPDDAAQRVALVEYAYDAESGDLAEVRDAHGIPFRYRYAHHLLTAETDRAGLTFRFAWDGTDENARCTRTWGDGGLYARRIEYNVFARETRVTDSRGATTLYEYNELGLVIREVDASGAERLTEYDENGRRWSETDPLGNSVGFGYDEQGRPTNFVDATGAEHWTQYDEAGNASASTDPLGAAWYREFDARGNVVAVVDPVDGETRYELDGHGLPLRVTDALGRETALEWDSAGNLVRVLEPSGSETRLEHDGWGRLIRRVDAEGGETRMRWDLLGRITEVRDAEGRTSRFRYDASGNLVQATDPLERARRYAYGAMGVLRGVVEPSGATTRYRYDAEGDLAGVRDAAGRVWSFGRDRLGRVTRERDFTGRTLGYGYDAAGQLVASTDARGQTTRMERDGAGRLVRRILADGAEERFGYDPAGRVVKAENADATVEWAYDPLGRVLREALNGEAVESRYDEVGNRVERTSPFGRTLSLDYDESDRLRAVNDPRGRLLAFEYDRIGRETRRVLPSGVVSERRYARTGELLEQHTRRGGTTLLRRGYRYDAAGQLEAVEDARFGATRYEHDLDGRLKATLYPDARLQQYLYDEAGNVPAAPVKRSAREIAFRLPGQLRGRVVERVTQSAGWTLRYDADANLVAKERDGQRWAYVYDGANRLARVQTPSGDTVTFTYDPLGRRVGKTYGGATTRFLWDGDLLLGETSGAGEQREYVFEPGSFAPAAVLGGAEDLLLETDQIGTPRTAYSRAGTIAWEADFGAWGNAPRTRTAAGGGSDEVRLRFPGQYEDAETGLCYNRFRYYDPELRAYTQADPIGIMGGENPHGYVGDPTGYLDPLGLASCKRPSGYHTHDVDAHGNLSPSTHRGAGHTNTRPDDFVQSHHPVQDAWAQKNVAGYSRDAAPAILLRSASGQPHALISAAQRGRRHAMKAQGLDPWATSVRDEFEIGYREMVDAGVPRDAARRAIARSYKYFDSLGAFGR
jgi:RHS repeat-associated protein